jgi:hypothetical protein
MMDGPSPRIHLCLTIWTLLLIGVVLVESRHLPLSLTVLLVPYLALMARHWVGRLRQRGDAEPATFLVDAAGSPDEDESDERADSPGSGGRFGYDNSPQPALLRPAEVKLTLPSRQVRTRRRPKTPQAEPLSAASWVQVQPGRFLRVQEMAPAQPADETDNDSRPDEPDGAPPSAEPGAPLEAGSPAAEADAEVSESEVQANHADEDVADATAPTVS